MLCSRLPWAPRLPRTWDFFRASSLGLWSGSWSGHSLAGAHGGATSACVLLSSAGASCASMSTTTPKYGGIACLLAAFGSGNFLVGCTDPMTTPFDPADPFYEIINVVVAVAVMIFVDTLSSTSSSPSERIWTISSMSTSRTCVSTLEARRTDCRFSLLRCRGLRGAAGRRRAGGAPPPEQGDAAPDKLLAQQVFQPVIAPR